MLKRIMNILNYAHIMLNYVMVINLCPLTQSTPVSLTGCSASEFVYSKLASEAENGYLDLRIYLVTRTSKKSPCGDYDRKGKLLCLLYYAAMIPALRYA